MAYNKTVWQNKPSTNSPVNANNMNKIEQGVYDNSLGVETIGDITLLDTTDKTSIVNAINENNSSIKNIGKLLWNGSFTSGEISAPGANNYTILIMNVGGCMCIGNKSYGAGGVGTYGSYSIQSYAYRLSYNSTTEKFSITTNDKGGTNGSSQVAITQIFGLF